MGSEVFQPDGEQILGHSVIVTTSVHHQSVETWCDTMFCSDESATENHIFPFLNLSCPLLCVL